jgi:aspartyl protease family protein
LRKALFPAIALFGAAALGFVSLRDSVNENLEVKPAVAEAAPVEPEFAKVTPHQIRTASLRKEGDGHYWATARVNGQPVKFLVDTGATMISLTKRDARKIGVNTDKLVRSVDVRTAAGRVTAGIVMVDRIEIDGVALENVQAVVLEDGLEYSLLGMNFLNKLEGWDVTPNAIVIHQ